MMTGALTFFLPCGFTQAMQLYAISTGDVATGALVMGAFALGTAPALLGIGGISSIMKGAMARIFYAVVGILVIAFGIYNIQSARAVLPASSGNEEINYTPIPQGTDPQNICAASLVVPSLGIQKNLKKGENIIEFTPTVKGSIPYACSMGMYRGMILVE